VATITFTITWLGGVGDSLSVTVVDNLTNGPTSPNHLQLKNGEPQPVTTSADDSGYGDVEIYRENMHSQASLLTEGENVNI
jgi:hypothetical protein